MNRPLLPLAILLLAATAQAQYEKHEYMVPMRDGVKLHTAVYTPINKPGLHPVRLTRTPYSCRPYGEQMRTGHGGSQKFIDAGYIFVYQDVRGRYMSEGDFIDIRPNNLFYTSEYDVDESTDTYDTVEWLINNVANNNGRVGMVGTSYPGFYTAIGAVHSSDFRSNKRSEKSGPILASWSTSRDRRCANGSACRHEPVDASANVP